MFPRNILLSLSLVLTIVLAGCSDDESKKIKHYQRALEYIKQDDTKAAVLELRNAIQLDPKYGDARYQLGLLYLKTGEPAAAFGELQRSFSIDPQNLDAGVKVAEFYLLSRNKEESRKYVDQILTTDPDYPNALALLANLELIEGNYDKALAAVDKALQKEPENDKFFNIRGRILVASGKEAEGEAMFRKAIAANPESFGNYRALLYYYDQSKNEAAKQDLLKTMLPKFPNDPQLHVMLAQLHQKDGKAELAEMELKKAIEIKNDSVPLRLMLIEFYKQQGKFDKAELALNQAEQDFPDEIQFTVTKADLLFDLQKLDEARKLMEEILATNPANGGANLIKARFMIHEKNNQAAIELLTPILTDYPKWPAPFYYAALAYLRLGKPELSVKAIEQAIENKPADDRYHALAAQIHLTLANSEKATQEAAIALKINPRNVIAVRILARSYLQAKKFEKVITLIQLLNPKVVSRDPELLEVQGLALLGMKRSEESLAVFQKLLELEPGSSRALGMVVSLSAGKDIERGIGMIRAQIAKAEMPGHFLLLGDLLAKANRYDDALTAFARAASLAPEKSQPYMMSAQLQRALGRNDDARDSYRKLLQMHPDSIVALMGLAGLAEAEGDIQAAKTNYQKVLDLEPEYPAAANNLAWILASEEDGDLGEALRLAMLAKQALPKQPHIADTLGYVHYKRKSYQLAIAQFEQALSILPNEPAIRYHLALVQWDNEMKKEAMANLSKALESDRPFGEQADARQTLEQWKRSLAGEK